MRPNIEITHTLNGRVKDYAAEHDLDLPEAYRRIIETGLAELDARDGETHDHEDSETERREDVDSRADGPDVRDDRVEEIVADVSESWEDAPDKLAARRDAARAALTLAFERGSLSKSEALRDVRPNHDVHDQNDTTWWKKNVQPMLREVGEHYPNRGYVVEDSRE
jgi:hypothetical protein